MNKKFGGIYAALVTPYTKDGAVDYENVKRLVRHLINNDIDGFYVGGSTAEAFLLTEEERKKILEAVVEENNGEKPVICHTGAISTDMAISYAKHAEAVGADAVSSISPFYYKFSEAEIIGFYQNLMEATALPMFVYNFPNFSGFSLTEPVLAELAKSPNLAGVKHTSSDFFLMQQIKARHPELVVWNGYDEMLTAGLSMGADGGIGSTYNCMPWIIRKVYDSFRVGDLTGAQQWQEKANRLISAICRYGVFASVKTLLSFEGIECNGCRRPFSPISDEGKAELKKLYEAELAAYIN